MKTKLVLVTVAALFFVGASAAQSGSNAERYFIESHPMAGPVPDTVDVRHDFGNLVSAELPPEAAERLSSRPGFEVRPVPKATLNAPPGSCSPWPGCKDGDDSDSDSGSNIVSVSWSSPADGSTLQGAVDVAIDASTTKSNIQKVEWKVDDCCYTQASYDSSSGLYTDNFQTSSFESGSHVLYAKATNKRGDTQTSNITVEFSSSDSPPVVAWTQPSEGDEVGGSVTLLINASDDSGVDSVEWAVDSGQLRTASLNSQGLYEDTWNTSSYGDETHSLGAIATDDAGQSSVSNISVNVNNSGTSNQAPGAAIVNPADGDEVSGAVEVTVNASDQDGTVEKVEWRIDSESYRSATLDSNGLYTATWNTSAYQDGTHSVDTRVTDDDGATASDSVSVTVNNTETVSRSYKPDDQTPYGIEQIYGDSSITSTSGGEGVDIAVLDTGIDTDHLDLKGSIEQCKDFTGSGSCEDSNGHGTHTAGTASADGGSDGEGIYGVAPESDIYAYRVCTSSGCYYDDIMAAIDEAAANDAEVVSMSLGGPKDSSLYSKIQSYNDTMLFVASSGNDGSDLETIKYPGANPSAVAVGAIDSSESVVYFSSRGVNASSFSEEEKYLEVAAAGYNVESTVPGGYSTKSGTSMSAPHVSGVAAKLWSSGAADVDGDGTVTPDEARQKIQDLASSNDITSGTYAREGYDPAAGIGLPALN